MQTKRMREIETSLVIITESSHVFNKVLQTLRRPISSFTLKTNRTIKIDY